MSDPFYDEGFEACMEGVDREECPYHEGSDGQAGWLRGWDDAEDES